MTQMARNISEKISAGASHSHAVSNASLQLNTGHSDYTTFKNLFWIYVIPTTCFLGMLSNTLNIIVFRNRIKLKNPIYGYMFVHSIAAFAFLAISFGYFFNKNQFYEQNYSYYFKYIETLGFMIVVSILYFFMIFVELSMSLKRLVIVSNYKIKTRLSFRCLTLLWLALSIFGQVPSFQIIDSISTTVESGSRHGTEVTHAYYDALADQCAKSTFSRVIFIGVSLVRGVLAPIFLFSVNLMMIVSFRKQTRKKQRMSSLVLDDRLINGPVSSSDATSEKPRTGKSPETKRANESLTRMIILVGFLFFISSLSATSTRIAGTYAVSYPNMFQVTYTLSVFIVIFAKSASFFVYYYFDNQFQTVCNDLVSKALVCAATRPR